MDVNEKADLLIKLLSDEKFLARMNDTENDISKMKALFASEGIELSEDKIKVIIDALDSAKKSMYTGEGLSDEDLEAIAGGGAVGTGLKVTGKVAKKAIKTTILTAGAICLAASGVGALSRMADMDSDSSLSDYASAAYEGAGEGLQFLGNVAVVAANNIRTTFRNFVR